jgi:hypothetical protein
MSVNQLERDETETVATVLAAVRPQLPAYVHDVVFHLRNDHDGDPGVWVWLVLDDATDVESRTFQDEFATLRKVISENLRRAGVIGWPYIYVRTDSEQRVHVAKGKP